MAPLTLEQNMNENTKASRNGAGAQGGEGVRMSREAVRLLTSLGAAGAYAISDPTEEGALILRAERAGVSLGKGRHPSTAGEELVRHDLAEAVPGPSGRDAMRISQAGRARLRRRMACDRQARFLEQHLDIVEQGIDAAGARERVRVDASESPLEWLRRRKDRDGEPMVDQASYDAGERLRRDLTAALMLPSVTVDWSAPAVDVSRSPGEVGAASDTVIGARRRVGKALDAVGSDFAGLLVDLCGFLKALERIERERGWPARSAKVVIKLALARLAEHYGFEREARGPAASRGIRTWRAPAPDGVGAA